MDVQPSPRSGATATVRPFGPGAMRALRLLHHALALAPVLAIGLLYAISWYAATWLGYWPRPMLDDPKFIAPGDPVYVALYVSALVLLVWSVAALFAFPLLTLALRQAYPRYRTWLLVAIFLIAWAILRADPGARGLWLMD